MVAKISFGNSLFGALAYNGEKINKDEGKLLATNRIFDDGTGKVNIRRAMEDFMRFMPDRCRAEKPVVHISLNPHPDDKLTDTDMENIAREYLEKMGFGSQPYMVYKHEDIDRHHMHIVTLRVKEDGKAISSSNNFYQSKKATRELEKKYNLHTAERGQAISEIPLRKVNASEGDVKKQIADRVATILRQLFDAKYPIQRMLLPDVYDADDETQMRDNNSSSFCYRAIAGTTKLSKHARGLAIDINTLYNPYYKDRDDGTRYIQPATAEQYCDRTWDFPYKIDHDDLCFRLFTEAGFEWGGDWTSCKDFQHFELIE